MRCVSCSLALLLAAGCGSSSPGPDGGADSGPDSDSGSDAGSDSGVDSGPVVTPVAITSLRATPERALERSGVVSLVAEIEGDPTSFDWSQVSGLPAALTPVSARRAEIDLSGTSVASDVELTFSLSVSGEDGSSDSAEVTVVVEPEALDNALGPNGHIGGSIDRIARFDEGGTAWIAFNVGSSLATTMPGLVASPVYRLDLPGVVEDIEIVMMGTQRVALVAMGRSGIAAVDLSDPAAPALLAAAPLHFEHVVPITVDSGGNPLIDYELTGPGVIVALATDGTSAWLADQSFGIHRVLLSTLLDPSARLADGSLPVEAEVFTLAVPHEETYWGGPTDVRLYGGKLFATLGVRGLAIYEPTTFEMIGGYNLYLDPALSEDAYVDMIVADRVQSDAGGPFLDPTTGMPDYRQAGFELTSVLRDGVVAPTPWFDLASGGQYFYRALSLDIAQFDGRTIAYVAWNNAGLVAVDVTGFEAAGTGEDFLTGLWLGYVPAVIPSGSGESGGSRGGTGGSGGLWQYQGSEHLKETGARRVAVHGTEAWISDHLGGVIAVAGADDPAASWRGATAPYDNDTNGIPGDQDPPWEFVTSYDMTATGGGVFSEPLPRWVYSTPALLATGEAGTGHGIFLEMMPDAQLDAAGTLDLVLATQAYGLTYADIVDLTAPEMADRYTVLDRIGGVDAHRIDVDGNPTGLVDLSETTGSAVSGDFLYVSDAPHGVYAWRVREDGRLLAQPQFAGATLPGLVSATIDGAETYPIHHAKGVLFDPTSDTVLVPSGGWGLRRGDVSDIQLGLGTAADPALIRVEVSDLFEHQTTFHPGSDTVRGPDRAFDVAIAGNLAYVADGTQGLTIYDLSRDPVTDRDFLVGNIGASGAELGMAQGIALWTDPDEGRIYAFVAAGNKGIGVIDVTDPSAPAYVKVFKPYDEQEPGIVGAADGMALDVAVLGENVVLAHDTFGVVVYRIADLIAPLPPGVDPLSIWTRDGTYDHRPTALSELHMEAIPGYEYVEDLDGAAIGLDVSRAGGRDLVWIAYGVGLARVDYTDPSSPVLDDWMDMTGDVLSVELSDGRVYVALSRGGLWILE